MSSAPATKPYRPLLLVEDEPSVMAYVRTALERSGYVVACVTNGERAIDMAKAEDFRGVISDMRTPGSVNGADLYDWLNLNRPTLAKRMLFITGDTVNEDTMKALQSTGVPYIEKPFRVQELINTVERIFGKAQ